MRGVDVEKYAYNVNKLRQKVSLETWIWRQIVTSQTVDTKRKWPPHATEWKPSPWKFSTYAIDQYSCRTDAEVKFYKYTFPILFLKGVLKAALITLCFIPRNDSEINKPNLLLDMVLYFSLVARLSDYDTVAIGKARAAYAQSFALWQQATLEFTFDDHSIIACSRHVHTVFFFTHIPFVVNHTINATSDCSNRRGCNNTNKYSNTVEHINWVKYQSCQLERNKRWIALVTRAYHS